VIFALSLASAASSVGDTSLLASRTSSFLRNGSDNRTATSPLLHGQQSPQLTSRTIVATSLESMFLTGQSNFGG